MALALATYDALVTTAVVVVGAPDFDEEELHAPASTTATIATDRRKFFISMSLRTRWRGGNTSKLSAVTLRPEQPDAGGALRHEHRFADHLAVLLVGERL